MISTYLKKIKSLATIIKHVFFKKFNEMKYVLKDMQANLLKNK